ncbi:alpha/beta fold hydrolase [Amycolatopsis jejuensis]|uniref:alpha/beta fold hydrolase n=1 Tax=Amycolatopsis jejuensis TaxID=330084 RepID=UPI00069110D6|nr:alpha/beta hydrolase [Amycolatopsis jejuensis]
MRVQHGFVSTRAGGAAHFLDFGGTGRTAVCLHGVTGHAWAWHDVAAELTAYRRVVALDLRGHGDSSWSAEGDYGTESQVDDLEDLLAVAGPGPVDVIGSSWGALIGLGFAARHPGEVASLSIVDIEPSFVQTETDVPERPRFFSSVEEIVGAERAATGSAPGPMLEVMAHFGTRPAEGGFVRKHDPYFFGRWPFRSDDRWGELNGLGCPALLVNAGKTFVQPDVMEKMRAAVDHGQPVRLVRLPEAAHVVPVDAPADLARELIAFFAELDGETD